MEAFEIEDGRAKDVREAAKLPLTGAAPSDCIGVRKLAAWMRASAGPVPHHHKHGQREQSSGTNSLRVGHFRSELGGLSSIPATRRHLSTPPNFVAATPSSNTSISALSSHNPKLTKVKDKLRGWFFWPLGEVVILICGVLPSIWMYSYKILTGTSAHFLGSKLFAFHILQASVFIHVTYIIARLILNHIDGSNLVLLSLLIAQVFFTKGFQKSMVDRGMHIFSYERLLGRHRRTFLTGMNLLMLVTYALRFYLALQEVRKLSRELVSGKKRRLVDHELGIDLDLSYITRNTIAMGFPTEDLIEQQYRNPMEQVQKLLEARHRGHYKVYNLCSERLYSQQCFEREYHEVRFPDHNPPPLAMIRDICQDMVAFLKTRPPASECNKNLFNKLESEESNVVVVHCKAGKGRTGLVVSSLLLQLKHPKCRGAAEALRYFAQKRTHDGKGVTIPSQIRYVHYYEAVLREGVLREPRHLRLTRISVTPDVPEDWWFQITTHEAGVIFNSHRSESMPLLMGDVKIVFFRGKVKLFHVWFHTSYDPGETQPAEPNSFFISPRIRVARIAGGEAVKVVWADSAPPQNRSQPVLAACFLREELDGPHKKVSSNKAMKVPLNIQVRLLFVEATAEEAERRKAATERENEREKRRATHATRRDSVDDYDDLEQDTDNEELMSILCAGCMVWKARRIALAKRRHCELHTSGRLHIIDPTGLNTLIVDLATPRENIVRDEENGRKWRVKNPRSQCWEFLEAEDEKEAEKWEAAFGDALNLGHARQEGVPFCGFFWKFNGDAGVDDAGLTSGFERDSWCLRLFVLRHDGSLMLSARRFEETLCSVCSPHCSIERLSLDWHGMPHVVVFQVAVDAASFLSDGGATEVFEGGGHRCILAAPSEDFEEFMMYVENARALYHNTVGNASGSFSSTFEHN